MGVTPEERLCYCDGGGGGRGRCDPPPEECLSYCDVGGVGVGVTSIGQAVCWLMTLTAVWVAPCNFRKDAFSITNRDGP